MAWFITGLRHEAIRLAKKHRRLRELRRLTTLLLNDPGGYSNKNKWRSVFIATPSDMYLWAPSDTAWVGNYPDINRVSINTINQWYDEDISISAP